MKLKWAILSSSVSKKMTASEKKAFTALAKKNYYVQHVPGQGV